MFLAVVFITLRENHFISRACFLIYKMGDWTKYSPC